MVNKVTQGLYWVVAGTLGLASTGCGESVLAEDPVDESALMDRSVVRGNATIQYAVAEGKPDELCIVPQHIVGGDYSSGDAESEAKLCSYNFHGATTGTSVAVCPKIVSTNPGVDVQALLEGKDAATTMSEICALSDRPTKLLAKYKQSMSCSYAPSILGYYHLSRALGGIGRVKPAVVRTMDLDAHRAVTQVGIASTTGLIQTLWRQFESSERNPAASRYRDSVYTTDLLQVYGALQENPRGETKYVDPISGRSLNVRGATDLTSSFRATAAYQAVLDGRPISTWVPRTLAGGAQRVVQMRDISDMVLLDTLLSQQDRFGNIHAVDYLYFQEGAELKKVKKSKVDDGERAMPAGAVVVREMLLKDNDCGVVKVNTAKTAGMLQQLRHMSPATYKHLRWLAASFGTGADVPRFLVREALFTQRDIDTVRVNLRDAAAQLHDRCVSGALQLDLDLAGHLSASGTSSLCEVAAPPNAAL